MAYHLPFSTPKPWSRGIQKVIIHPSWLPLDSVMEACARKFFPRGSLEELHRCGVWCQPHFAKPSADVTVKHFRAVMGTTFM
jgi:hypothetical protein